MSTFQTLVIEKRANPKIVKLLENNVIGTPGRGMLYKLLNVKDKIDRLLNPYFISVQKNEKVLGTCCFDQRQIANARDSYKAFYVRYFSFMEQFRRKNVVVKAKKGKSIIKKEVEELLNGKGLIEDNREKLVFYAYVDLHNDRSRILCEEFGFKKVREFEALLYSRLLPSRSKNVSKAADLNEIKQMLGSFYGNYNFVDLDLIDLQRYYVIRDKKGNIVAGLQANLEHWNIVDIPGLMGRIILNVIPRLPILKKFFNQDYHFLSFDSIFVKEGHEKSLVRLFNHLLNINQIKVASICLDVQSSLYHKIKQVNMGFMDRLSDTMIHQVIAKTINFNDEEIEQLHKEPVYISSFDIT